MRITMIFVMLFLAGCAATGPIYNEEVVHADKNSATLVIYRPNVYAYSLQRAGIEVNGKNECDLYTGSFFIKSDIMANEVNLSASQWSMPGTSRLRFKVEKGKIYYILMTMNYAQINAGVIGGLIGQLAVEATNDENQASGPYVFTLIEENMAKEQLKQIRLDEKCK